MPVESYGGHPHGCHPKMPIAGCRAGQRRSHDDHPTFDAWRHGGHQVRGIVGGECVVINGAAYCLAGRALLLDGRRNVALMRSGAVWRIGDHGVNLANGFNVVAPIALD